MTDPAKLAAHFENMQDMARRYIEPLTAYVDRDGKRSDDIEGEKQSVRSDLFAGDMIYMLDGPEQREAQR